MTSILLYLATIFLSVTSLNIFQRAYVENSIKYQKKREHHYKRTWRKISAYQVKMFLLFMIGMLPIIILYGVRYGIGTDYYAYETMYELLHGASFSEYWYNHSIGRGDYYVEFGYFLLNKISGSYVQLQFILILIMSCVLFTVLREYENKVSKGMGVFIFLSTQFIYAMNGTRFIIAALFLLWAYTKIEKGNKIEFLVLVICAAFFHKSALICVAFYFLKEFSGSKWNKLRNLAIIAAILLLPVAFTYIMEMMSKISLFSRYFTADIYTSSSAMFGVGLMWLMHIVPVLFPIALVLSKKRNTIDSELKILFRICCMEIPLRILSFYNPLYGRLARYAQIAQCVLVPYSIGKIKSQKIKLFLTCYYIAWYIFYFVYFIIIIDGNHSIPYEMVFK